MSINQWEVWDVDFNPTRGHEINKSEPAIVVNDQRLGKLKLKIVIPITDVKLPAIWHEPITPSPSNGLSKLCYADCFQLKSISEDRFVRKRGSIEPTYFARIQLKLMLVLGLKV